MDAAVFEVCFEYIYRLFEVLIILDELFVNRNISNSTAAGDGVGINLGYGVEQCCYTVSVVAAALVLDERLTLMSGSGALLTLAGLFISQMDGRR